MPAQPFTYSNFSGGVNKQISPIIAEPNEEGFKGLFFAEDSYNWEMSEAGLIKFPGYDAVITSPVAARVDGAFEFNNNGTKELIECKDGKVYRVAGGVETQIYTGNTAGHFYQSEVFNNTLLLMNGVDKVLAYNGTTCTQVTMNDPDLIWNDARPFAAVVFRNRIFFLTEEIIYTPASGGYDDFDNTLSLADAFYIERGKGGDITAAKPLTDNILIIYKEGCIRRLSGTTPFGTQEDPFIISVVSDETGCIARRSVCQVGVEHYYLGQNGLRQLKPVDSYGDISTLQPTYPIQPLINTVNYDSATILNACAIYVQPENKIHLAVPDGASTTNNTIYLYDTITKTNEPRGQTYSAACLAIFNRKLYHGDYTGQLYKHGDVNSLNGASQPCQYTSKYIAHFGVSVYKAYRRMVISVEGEGATDTVIRWTILNDDEELTESETGSISSGALWDVALWDQAVWAAGSMGTIDIKNLGRGKAIKLEFLNNTPDQRPKIRQIDLYVEPFSNVRG